MVLPATLCVRERANFGRLGSFSFFSYKKDIGIMWDFDKKKMWGVKPHIGIGTMKKMSNLICGKFTAGRNYNLTLNTRQIPMTDEVKECFKRIIEKRKAPKHEPIIYGVKGFLYLDKNEMPMVALHWEKYFEHICEKHNKIYKEELPNVTPHVCRHTFATNMARSGMNPKSLQILMGHADISTTLNIYTHLGFDDVQREILEISKLQS